VQGTKASISELGSLVVPRDFEFGGSVAEGTLLLEPLHIALLTVTAFAAGTVDAIAGGGGLLTLPALLASGLPPQVALGTNKGQSVFGSGSALLTYARRGLIDTRRACWVFPLGFIGALVGVEAVLHLSRETLRPVVIVLLVVAAAFVATRQNGVPHAAPPTQDPAPARLRAACLIALGVGCYDGFFGPGTGTFLIVLFMAVLKDSVVGASANAKVVNFASNLASVLWFAHAGSVDWSVALPMATGQLAGGYLGARLTVRNGQALVRRATLAVVAGLILKLTWDLINLR
jgi:uncharacterized membrane protein YfcA